jgi:hypothetical protein
MNKITTDEVMSSSYYNNEQFVSTGRGYPLTLEEATKLINDNAPRFIGSGNIKNNKDELIKLIVMIHKTGLTKEQRDTEVISSLRALGERGTGMGISKKRRLSRRRSNKKKKSIRRKRR